MNRPAVSRSPQASRALEKGNAGTGYIQNLQILRFVAALMVLLSHLEHEVGDHRIPRMAPFFDPTGISWATGVDVFFIVSGFIMYHLSSDNFGSRAFALEFFKRRLIRIVPLYWFFTTFMLLAIWLFPGQIHHSDAGILRVVSSYLFFPIMRADGLALPVLAIGWTLNFEMLFYSIYSVALTFRRTTGLVFLGAAFTALYLMAAFSAPSSPLHFWGQPIIFEFLMGITLAACFGLNRLRFGRVWQVGLIISAIVLMGLFDRVAWSGPGPMLPGGQPPDWSRLFWGGIPAFLLSIAFVEGPAITGRAGRYFSAAGDASYALYLSHPFTLTFAAMVWVRFGLPTSPIGYVVSGTFECMIIAWLIYRYFELPVLYFLRSSSAGARR